MATDAKRLKTEGSDPLQSFLQWCEGVGLKLNNKVYISKEGTVAEYGMLAKEDIDEGELLFTIPRMALLHQGTTKVLAVLEEGKASLENTSGWVPLLLALMYEYTSPQSHWRPYLSLWSDFTALDHPMFWSKDERDRLLKGTGIPEAVDTDLTNIQKEYKDIVLPFITLHPDLWDPERHTLDLYRSLVAFVMAYSFQEPLDEEDEDEKDPNPPMMVPIADMLNHVSNHNANLEYTPECLKMVSVRSIRKGEEVFNTYGQMANWQLLHMYGFAEPYQSNSNDTADIPMSNVYKAAVQVTRSEAEQRLLVEKWSLLCEMEMVGDKGVFIFGKSGSLTDTEMYTTLKILCMSVEEFEDFRENEGWEEADDDEEKMLQALSNEGLPSLLPLWRRLVHAAARFTLDSYGEDMLKDKVLLEDKDGYVKLSSRQRRALQVRYGQKTILHQLMELTKP
ncbi:N-lysine methyltransferase setd6 [Salvelinus namaycush]|uniref:N-lysine methyltransferase SETD6 n=1 Tax=Salvelinus namaycush TaxID=8040 RepID=A0A8U0U8D5_SALNM|nr:N-lysine methyltransferase setd6 [Salvelinus namaycush]